MNWLTYLRHSIATKMPTVVNPPRPAPAHLLLGSDGTNPIHQLLDEFGLPWHEPRRDLEVRIGIADNPIHGNRVLFFPEALLLPGALHPWQTSVFDHYAPDMPVVRFTGLVWFANHAAINIERTAEFFAKRLGAATIGQEYNTLVCRWQAGAASVQLQCWPPAWQSGDLQIEAHAREPRLATACHVTLLTGFRLSLTAEEEAWVQAFQTIADTRPMLAPPKGGLIASAPRDTEVEYARDAAGYLPSVQNRVGCPPGCEALILCTHQLFVLRTDTVLGFEVLRLTPAKGSGGSTLLVRCRTSCAAVAYKTLHVAQHDEPDGMVPLGRELAALFNKPYAVSRYFDDV